MLTNGGASAILHQIGGTELLIFFIVVAVLLLFGPSKLPEFARAMGRAWGEFRRGKMEIERELRQEFARAESGEELATRDEVIRAAKELSVTREGREVSEIKLEIARAIEKTEGSRLVAVAKVFGLEVEGVGAQKLREQIIRRLHV